MEQAMESNAKNFQDIAADALKKTSAKLIGAAPDNGPLTNTAVSLASAIENMATTLSEADINFDEILPTLRKLPWKSLATGAALLAGGVYLSNNKKAVSGFTKELDVLLQRAKVSAKALSKKSKKGTSKAKPKKRAAKKLKKAALKG